MVGKGDQIQTLHFFLVLTCLSTGSNSPFGAPPEFGARKLMSPYMFIIGFQLTSLSYHLSPSTTKKTCRPLTSAYRWWEGHPLTLKNLNERHCQWSGIDVSIIIVWFSLGEVGLVRFGLVWIGSVWFGLDWFGLVSLSNGIGTFMGYLIPKSFLKNISGKI